MNYRLMTDRDRHNYMFRQTNGLAGKQIKIERQRQRQRQANWYGPLYCLTDTSTIETPHSYMPINMLMSAISSRVHSARSNTPSKAKLPCVILWAIEPIAVRPLGTKQLLGITTTPHNRQVTQKMGRYPTILLPCNVAYLVVVTRPLFWMYFDGYGSPLSWCSTAFRVGANRLLFQRHIHTLSPTKPMFPSPQDLTQTIFLSQPFLMQSRDLVYC